MKATIKTELYAKKLRAAIAAEERSLQTARLQNILDVKKWREDLVKFLRTVAVKRVEAVRPGKKRSLYSSRMRNTPDWDTLFEGAPEYPEPPESKRIQKLKKRLNYIALAAPASIIIDEDDDLIPSDDE